MLRLSLVLSFLFSVIIVQAQFDTNYVHLTKNQFTAYPMGETAYMELHFKDLEFNDGIYTSTLTSRNTTSIGFGMSFSRLGFSFSFQIPYSDIPELKNSKAFNFAGGYSYHRFYGELRYRDYSGFQKMDIIHDSIKGDIHLRKDIKMRQLGVVVDYFFSKKFNFDASYKNYNVQKKSAASFLLMAGVNKYDISGNYLFWDSLHYTSDIEFIRDLDIWEIKFAPGGAFTLIYKGFYTSSMVALGMSYNNNTFYGDINSQHVSTWAPVFEARAVLGYNTMKWFASLSLNIENDYFFYDKVDLSVTNVFFNLKAGYKFNSKYLGKLGKYL